MARKNLLSGLIEAKLPDGNPDNEAAARTARSAPSALAGKGAIGAVSRSLEQLKQQVSDAQRVQERLVAGQAVIELDPGLVDASFVADRLEETNAAQTELRDSIQEHGQLVPILVRPNPSLPGRFQVAYGHRRLKAVSGLNRKVRAVVRELSNEELVVAQGLENSARTNLSFLERALYAARLEEQGFGRDTIMAALAIDKTALSKLITVPAKLPRELVLAIGAAPKIGRDRWLQLVDLAAGKRAAEMACHVIATPRFLLATSDDRFEIIFRELSANSRKPGLARANLWKDEGGLKIGRVLETPNELTVTVHRKAVPGFADFIRGELPKLLARFRTGTESA
jgi:ParB family transcriptional regulator, chromosome partitioning protein